jgi:hypothetical protein
MMGPISTLGRAAEASVQQKQSSGMPPDQAVAYTEQLLLDGISPDLETMMAQASQLRQMQRKPPQMTIRDQLNQAYQGIANLPTPGFQPGFAGGGIVAFASGDLVDDMMPRLTPEQIRMQMMRQKAAEGRMGLGSYGIGLENYPELIEDVPEGKRVVTNIVDDKGNLWHKLEDGTFRQASGKRLEGAKIEGGRLVYPDRPSIVQREATAYRAGQSSGIRGLPGPDVTVDRTSGRDVVTDRRPTTATPDVKKPGRISRGLAALGPVAVAGGVGAMISDVGERAEAQRGEGADTGPVISAGPMGIAYSTKSAPKPSDIGDMFSSFFSGATLGIFGDREAERAAERKAEAKPEEKSAVKPKPSGGMAPAAKPRGGMFDIPIAIETARATLNYAVKEDDEFQKLLKRAEAEGTGPYSKMFTEGDRIKTERMEALKKSKDSNFGRALVAAGLAMAQQAAKGGQPGNESQKFLAAAVEGLGGYMKAQEFLGQEREKAQKELDKFTLDMEQLREASRGDLRGLALKRFNDAQARAEKANDNARGLMIVQKQMEYAREALGIKTAASLQNAQTRAQSQLMAQAQKEVADSPAYMAAQIKYAQATQAKNPKEQQAALTEMNNLIRQRVQMNMQIPSYMAGIQYNPASGDLDFSATDAIVDMALGTGK